MSLNLSTIKRLFKRKLATVVLVSASMAAFAISGDGRRSGDKELFNSTSKFNSKNFSIRSGYNYRSNNLLTTPQSNFIMLNTVTTFQKGNVTYVLPLKKKVLLDKIKFAPSSR